MAVSGTDCLRSVWIPVFPYPRRPDRLQNCCLKALTSGGEGGWHPLAPTHHLVLLTLASSFIQVEVQAQCPTLPPPRPLQNIATLPDPFSWYPAQDGRNSSADDWTCRRDHITTLLQQLELGEKPPTPSSATATLSGNTLSITASESGKASSSTSPSHPGQAAPGHTRLSSPTAPSASPSLKASQQLPSKLQHHPANRYLEPREGLFYDLYGPHHPPSAMVTWAWGVSVLIDALELECVADTVYIDTTRFAVTGCSRNGKGALIAGAFDDRIALTIP
ncbi:hypothetical protein BDV12DRAFT_202436 [Aspergillus spectabilis]